MKKVILFLAFCGVCHAQNRTVFAGVRNAWDYAYGINPRVQALSVAIGNSTPGVRQIIVSSGYIVSTDGTTFSPIALTTPIRIGSGNTVETIIPSIVNCQTPQVYGTCNFTATFLYPHGIGDIIASGTVGLQEAINLQASTGGTEVSIDANWAAAGGTTAMIQAAVTGPVSVAAPFVMSPGVPPNPCGALALDINLATAALYACTVVGGNWTLAGGSGTGMVWPPNVGVANYAGSSSWGTSYTVGTGSNNLIQLNGSAQLPAVSAALLTNFPILNQNTTGTASNVTGIVGEPNGGTGANNTPGAAGHVLRSNGAHYVDGAIQATDVPTLNQSTSGNAATATALATTPSQCGGGTPLATGVAANGNANCTAAGTSIGGADAIQASDGAGGFRGNSGDTKDTNGNEVIRGGLTTGSGTTNPGTWTPQRVTVANLNNTPPAFSAGSIREVSDGNTTCDTTVGGGSNTVLAQYTGAVWQPVNAACGSGGACISTAGQGYLAPWGINMGTILTASTAYTANTVVGWEFYVSCQITLNKLDTLVQIGDNTKHFTFAFRCNQTAGCNGTANGAIMPNGQAATATSNGSTNQALSLALPGALVLTPGPYILEFSTDSAATLKLYTIPTGTLLGLTLNALETGAASRNFTCQNGSPATTPIIMPASCGTRTVLGPTDASNPMWVVGLP